ncbi:hypothetical protein M422DRAFT_213220 [Sphaerobolus stellatus SS14]|uniref:NADP-dependent oxidoreductase domain-containing protein n=1 Tax=Sphaerobolus stellatus (strain SS14) TaxID=990650 RepID=A0A0C9UHG3_SPHS4|nr:hypothetical protein M422DRAFT_213220 [Sphaerobolus stellatus SS14]
MLEDIPQFELNSGANMPAIGIGCWMGRVGEGDHVSQMIKRALELGYRHIDTAANYGNEESVGKGLRNAAVPRKEIFLTTKLAGEDHGRVEAALDISLQKLGEEYVDLYLMHWPQALHPTGEALRPEESPTFIETWRAMEGLLDTGKVKSIGVSNFSIKTLAVLLQHARVVPAINQVEAHPCLPQNDLLAFCLSRGILLTAYSPVGKFKYASDPTVVDIARNNGCTEAQVLLSWGVQRGTVVIPKTEKEERLKENLKVVRLTSVQMHSLDALHRKPGMHRSVCGFHSAELGGSCFGWTYEQLGWNMSVGGVVDSGV